jgi:hypothetical protein
VFDTGRPRADAKQLAGRPDRERLASDVTSDRP